MDDGQKSKGGISKLTLDKLVEIFLCSGCCTLDEWEC